MLLNHGVFCVCVCFWFFLFNLTTFSTVVFLLLVKIRSVSFLSGISDKNLSNEKKNPTRLESTMSIVQLDITEL